MPTTDPLRLTLVRPPDDEASFSPGYQRELRQFYSLARAEGGKISAVTFTTDHADGGDGFVGEFMVPFTPVARAHAGGSRLLWEIHGPFSARRGVHTARASLRLPERPSRAHVAPDNWRR